MVTIASEDRVGRDEALSEECFHHWLIDSPSGPTSTGVCRLCGAEREFRNFLEGARWEDDSSSGQAAASVAVRPSASIDASQDEES